MVRVDGRAFTRFSKDHHFQVLFSILFSLFSLFSPLFSLSLSLSIYIYIYIYNTIYLLFFFFFRSFLCFFLPFHSSYISMFLSHSLNASSKSIICLSDCFFLSSKKPNDKRALDLMNTCAAEVMRDCSEVLPSPLPLLSSHFETSGHRKLYAILLDIRIHPYP